MSLRPGLLASTSRLVSPLTTPRSVAAHLARAASSQATSNPSAAPKVKRASVQDADKQIRDLERAKRRMPQGIELDNAIRGVIMGASGSVLLRGLPN